MIIIKVTFQPADKITLDKDCAKEVGLKIPKDILEHLEQKEKLEIKSIIEEFPNFWAKTKYDVGNFRGFKASIPTMEGKTAVQKNVILPSLLESITNIWQTPILYPNLKVGTRSS